MVLLHGAHLLVSAAELSFFSRVEGGDVRPIAWVLVSVHKDLSAMRIYFTSELKENLAVRRFPGSGGLKEVDRSRFQACHGLNRKNESLEV